MLISEFQALANLLIEDIKPYYLREYLGFYLENPLFKKAPE